MSATAYSIAEMADMMNGELHSSSELKQIKNILIDSRKAYSPNDSIFFAIVGERHNGHNYIKSLIEKGVRNFVISDKGYVNDHANFIVVKSVLVGLQLLAEVHRNKFSANIIGITGSNGKTIIKEWLYQLLKDSYFITRNPKSYNSQVGVPISAWLINEETELGIFEAGISTVNEMKNLQQIINPNIGIFTNIGSAHNDGFESDLEKVKEKAILFKNSNQIIYCKDVEIIDTNLKRNFSPARLFTWSRLDPETSVYVKNITKINSSSTIEFVYNNETSKFTIPFSDDASIENSIHCICAVLVLGRLTSIVLESTQSLTPVSMRLELKKGINQSIIINDSYNSDTNSLKVALDFLNQQHENKTLILSDIFEQNRTEKELYKEVSSIVNSYPLYRIIAIGKNLTKHINLFNLENISVFDSTDQFINQLKNEYFNHEAILIKGARSFSFEKITKRLELQAHETRLEIDLNAMTDNLNYYRSKVKKSTKIMVMVKAFSYGSGSVEIANMLQYNRVDYLAVAYADEGVELRKSGITLPIMVMNPEKNSFDSIIKYNLEPEIYSFSLLGHFIEILEQNFNSPQLPYPIHIKVDTGMHRLGFTPMETEQVAYVLNNCKSTIKVKSVFSHLSSSNNLKEKTFTEKQIKALDQFSSTLSSIIGYSFMKHILNSGGIENFPQAQFDMVRLGIGLYGMSNNTIAKKLLRSVSTLKSTISQIKLIEPGESVGYNRSARIKQPTRIAIVAIGYADGIDRKLGNGNYYFIINNQKAPTIGDICMDMCILDVTNISCHPGDEVIIFGNNHPLEYMATTMGTITYELLTGVSRRVKRVYFQE